MDSTKKLVLVTGSNRGIGYGIVEGLLQKKKYRVILSARNEDLGLNSYKTLSQKYPTESQNFFFHQLDITDKNSITNLIHWIKEKFNKIDYLVNNAGVYSSKYDYPTAKFIFDINVYGTISFTERMIKENMIQKRGKIISLGSTMGSSGCARKDELYTEFLNIKTTEDLISLADRFISAVKNGAAEKEGWSRCSYSVSKLIINSYPKVLAKKKEIIENEIGVYSADPGWVKTNIGGSGAPLTIKEGAATEIYLIELPDGINKEYQGKYFSNSRLSSF